MAQPFIPYLTNPKLKKLQRTAKRAHYHGASKLAAGKASAKDKYSISYVRCYFFGRANHCIFIVEMYISLILKCYTKETMLLFYQFHIITTIFL